LWRKLLISFVRIKKTGGLKPTMAPKRLRDEPSILVSSPTFNAKRRNLVDEASNAPALPNELLWHTLGIGQARHYYDNAPNTLHMYKEGDGNKLSAAQFKGLFGQLFVVDAANPTTYKPNVGKDAVNFVVQFVVAYELEVRRERPLLEKGYDRIMVKQSVLDKMYAGLDTAQCEWADDIRSLHTRIAQMRLEPPHVVALIVTWLNMVFVQLPRIEAQRMFLTLLLMRYDTLKVQDISDESAPIDIIRIFNGAGGHEYKISVRNQLIEDDIDSAQNIEIFCRLNDDDAADTHTITKITLKVILGWGVSMELISGEVDENDYRNAEFSSDGNQLSYDAARALSTKLVDGTPFITSALNDPHLMWHCFFGVLEFTALMTEGDDQALLAARAKCA
jgi:hypothetical protein